MEHIKAILIKFTASTLILGTVLSFYGVPLLSIIWMSLALTYGSYFVVDLILLPHSNNLIATFGDFVLTWAGVWRIGVYLVGTSINWMNASLIAVIFLGVFEWVFHKYLVYYVFREKAKFQISD